MEKTKNGSKSKKAVLIVVLIATAIAAGLLLWKFVFRGSGGEVSGNKAYVDTVANWTGAGSGLGVVDRFAGVVESQETWSVNQNPDVAVKEIHVTVGQKVKKDEPLFTYDVEEYQAKLDQANIDRERLLNEQKTLQDTLEQLKKDKAKAAASEQADYTVRIQEQEISIKQKELEIASKQTEIEKISLNMANATVTSEIDGVIKSINKGGNSQDYFSGESDNAFITVMKTGDLRIKGTVNEQNIQALSEQMPVIVYSRAGNATWRGIVSKIDTENTVQQTGGYASYDTGSETSSSKYPFYVELEDGTGLMMGQHVYLEPDLGQSGEERKEGIWLDEFLIDQSDPGAPFVWADNGHGRLEKRRVTIGAFDEERMQYQITEGLEVQDRIAQISEDLTEGMPTADMEEYWQEMMSDAENLVEEEVWEDEG